MNIGPKKGKILLPKGYFIYIVAAIKIKKNAVNM